MCPIPGHLKDQQYSVRYTSCLLYVVTYFIHYGLKFVSFYSEKVTQVTEGRVFDGTNCILSHLTVVDSLSTPCSKLVN